VKSRSPVDKGAVRAHRSAVARRVLIGIAEAWLLTDDEQVDLLSLNGVDALNDLRRPLTEPLPRDVLIRISNLLKIYKALPVQFPHGENADGWVRRPNRNPVFGGKPALALMTTRQLADLVRVREYLEAQSWAH